ncbi:hypothetical protein BDK51DRAFT_30159, partial [Blyttiomyces helicus]
MPRKPPPTPGDSSTTKEAGPSPHPAPADDSIDSDFEDTSRGGPSKRARAADPPARRPKRLKSNVETSGGTPKKKPAAKLNPKSKSKGEAPAKAGANAGAGKGKGVAARMRAEVVIVDDDSNEDEVEVVAETGVGSQQSAAGSQKSLQRWLIPKSSFPDEPKSFAEADRAQGPARHDDGRLWIDKYRPAAESELAVHKKKIDDVRSWFKRALSSEFRSLRGHK